MISRARSWVEPSTTGNCCGPQDRVPVGLTNLRQDWQTAISEIDKRLDGSPTCSGGLRLPRLFICQFPHTFSCYHIPNLQSMRDDGRFEGHDRSPLGQGVPHFFGDSQHAAL